MSEFHVGTVMTVSYMTVFLAPSDPVSFSICGMKECHWKAHRISCKRNSGAEVLTWLQNRSYNFGLGAYLHDSQGYLGYWALFRNAALNLGVCFDISVNLEEAEKVKWGPHYWLSVPCCIVCSLGLIYPWVYCIVLYVLCNFIVDHRNGENPILGEQLYSDYSRHLTVWIWYSE